MKPVRLMFLLISSMSISTYQSVPSNVSPPTPGEHATIEAVQRSLSMVDPAEQMALFAYDRSFSLDVSHTISRQEQQSTWLGRIKYSGLWVWAIILLSYGLDVIALVLLIARPTGDRFLDTARKWSCNSSAIKSADADA